MTDGPGRHNMFGSLLTSEPGTGSEGALRGPSVTEPDLSSLEPHHLAHNAISSHVDCQPCEPEKKRQGEQEKGNKAKLHRKGGASDKAKEDAAIRRILKKRKPEAMLEPGTETDDELIELCWQDLLKDDSKKQNQDLKKPRPEAPVFDENPKLPGSSSTTKDICERLWHRSEIRSLSAADKTARRISVNQHTASQEGKHSENYAKRSRGASSERASKVSRGNAGRIHSNDLQAINRIAKRVTATAKS